MNLKKILENISTLLDSHATLNNFDDTSPTRFIIFDIRITDAMLLIVLLVIVFIVLLVLFFTSEYSEKSISKESFLHTLLHLKWSTIKFRR